MLFGILKKADPTLVDPGATAQLECLLDDVVIGKQEMIGAIDAVCDVAQRIIGKLKAGAADREGPLLGSSVVSNTGERPPTPAMKRFAVGISRQKGIKPPPGYTKSGSICRGFLDQHAPKKRHGETPGDIASKQASPAQLLFAEKIAQEHGVVIPDEAKASSAAMSTWIESNQKKGRDRRGSKSTQKPKKQTAPKMKPRNRTGDIAATAVPLVSARQNLGAETPLQIPYGNKDDALELGARYRSGGWYAPSGVDLAAFGERGWL